MKHNGVQVFGKFRFDVTNIVFNITIYTFYLLPGYIYIYNVAQK